MTVIATPAASLLTGLNYTQAQPAISPSLAAVSSSFLQALEITASDTVTQMDFHGQRQSTPATLENGVLDFDGASLMPSNQKDDSEKEYRLASASDAVWLATWFQNNAPESETETVSSNSFSHSVVAAQSNATAAATVPSSSPLLEKGSNRVDPALIEAPSKPLAMFSSESSSRIDEPSSEKQKQSPWVSPDKPVNALPNAPSASPSSAAANWKLPSTSAIQATSPPASIGLLSLDRKSSKNFSTDSDNLRSTDLVLKAPFDSPGSLKLGQSVEFKDFKDFGNDLWMPALSGSAPIGLDSHIVQNFAQQTVGTEAVLQSHSSDVQWTSNLEDTVNQWVARSSPSPIPARSNAPATVSSPFPLLVMVSGRVEPALIEAPSRPLVIFSSEFSSTMDVPRSEQQKQSPWVSTNKPINALTHAPTPSPSSAAVSGMLPSTSASQATSPPASIGLLLLEKKSPKNFSTESDNLRSTEVFFKAPIDTPGSVKLGQAVGFKDFKDSGNDLWMPVMPGSAQVSLDHHIDQIFTHQSMGAEVVPQSHSPDVQWTSNLADTVKQWGERSLQLAELTVPDAGQDSLQVRIELNGKEATVYFLTDHVQYRDAIESQIENLSDRLADQGLKLAGSFIGQGSAQNSPHKQSAHSMLSRHHENEPALAKVLPIDPVLREMKSVHHGQVLDVFA